MEDFLTCDICGKPANIHLTQIMNGKMIKTHLCESCANHQGLMILKDFLEQQFSLPQSKVFKTSKSRLSVQTCPKCHYSPHLLKKNKKLGCPECYQHFANAIKHIKQANKALAHQGKCPPNALQRQGVYQQIFSLEQQMQLAINEERYEDAATYRDALKKFKDATISEDNPLLLPIQ